MWNLKKQNQNHMNKQTKSRIRPINVNIENKLIVTRGEVGEWMGEIGDGD